LDAANLIMFRPNTAMFRCPTCNKEFSSDDSSNMPFCSERCRLVDLGRWLDERFAVPAEPDEDRIEEMMAENNGSE